MRRGSGPIAALVLAGLLAACGSDKTPSPVVKVVTETVKGSIGGGKKAAAPARPAVTRAALAQFKTPMILAELPSVGYFTFVVPYGQNGEIETWASTDKKTIAFRGGLIIGTRGFGPDLMQSSGPSISQIASASGSYSRTYVYLDGADQTQRREFTCTLSNLGSTAITVVESQHTVRHIAETCAGESGEFTNEYWFENGVFLRKSKQLLNLEWGAFTLSRVIDKG
jgi:hypothetical protein